MARYVTTTSSHPSGTASRTVTDHSVEIAALIKANSEARGYAERNPGTPLGEQAATWNVLYAAAIRLLALHDLGHINLASDSPLKDLAEHALESVDIMNSVLTLPVR